MSTMCLVLKFNIVVVAVRCPIAIAMVLASDKAIFKSKHWGDTQSSSWMISR